MSKSASGKASSGNSQSDLDSSVECPTCGKSDFKSRKYMKIHHNHAHGESIAGEDVECEMCGDILTRLPHEIEKYDRFFCSDECQGEYKTKNWVGEDSPNYRGGKNEYECHACGDTVEKWESQRQYQDHVFCSDECRIEEFSQICSGKNEDKWAVYECDTCGDKVKRRKSRVKRCENVFCSRNCADEFHSKRMRGEGNPRWEGGNYNRYYGANWEEQREKALQRDNQTCQCCGDDNDETTLSVHHVHKIRYYQEQYDAPEWWERANDLSNLITLCLSCHGKWEGIPLRIDNRQW